MRTRTTVLTTLAGALAVLALLAGCGGSDDSGGGSAVDAGTDAQAVLDSALGSGGESIKSGVLDLSFDLSSQSGQAVSANASVTGPFMSNGGGELPSVDFDVKAGAGAGGPTLGFEGGLTLTPDGLFVNYSGTDYKVDDSSFQKVKDGYAQSVEQQDAEGNSGSLAQLGIDPSTWLTDVSSAGEEDVDGSSTVHITGTADVAKIVSDLDSAGQKTQQSSQIDAAVLKQLGDSVKSATVDVYANTDDGSLRKLDLNLGVSDPQGGSGTDTIKLSIGISEPNSEQSFPVPENAQPISDLVGQLSGVVSSLGGLAPSSDAPPAADTSPGGGTPGGGSATSGGSSSGGGSPGVDSYFGCVQQAQSKAELDACAKASGG